MIFPNSNVSADQATSSRGAEAGAGEISILDILQVLVENLRLLMVLPLIVGLIALGVGFILTPVFTASTKFLPPQQQQGMAASMLQSLGALGGLAASAGGLKNPSDQYVAFLNSESVQEPLVDQFKLMERFKQKYRDDARKMLESNTRIINGKDGLIVVSYDDRDPVFASQVANAYVEKLGALLSRLAVTEAQQRRLFFERQLSEAKDKLIKSEQALKATGVSSSVLRVTPQSAVEGIARLQAQITAQEVKVASMRGYLTENAPELKQAQIELNALRVQSARAQQDSPRVTNPGSDDYIARYREFKYNETLFELFARQYESAKLDESREGAIIQVVDVAKPPERKSGPKRGLIAVASTLAAFFLLVFYVFVKNALQRVSENSRLKLKILNLKLGVQRALGR